MIVLLLQLQQCQLYQYQELIEQLRKDAAETIDSEDFRAKMPKQIYSSVYWTQTIEKMSANGVEIFIEIGPGKVLAGLNKKIVPEAKVFNIFDKASLDATIASLKEELVLV